VVNGLANLGVVTPLGYGHPPTSLGAGIDVAYDLIDVLGELCSRVSGPPPRSELRPQRLE
jgi:hypothetical protein